MTEERFKFVCDDENCFFKQGNKVLYCYEVVDVLNKLIEEKEQLKKNIGNPEHTKDFYADYTRLEKENEELKKDNYDLKLENKQLKEFLKGAKDDINYKLNKISYAHFEIEKATEKLKKESDDWIDRFTRYVSDWDKF